MLQSLWNIPRNMLIGGVKLYQLVLSPHLGSACRFTPTCSEYTIQALRKYGALKGFILGAHRIMRCNPWGGHGYDPPRWYGEAPAPSDGSGSPGAETDADVHVPPGATEDATSPIPNVHPSHTP